MFDFVLAGVASLLAQVAPPGRTSTIQTDGHVPAPRQEFASSYHCPTIRAAIRYRIERRQSPDPAGGMLHRVTLLAVSVNGRALPRSQFDQIRDRFAAAAALDVQSAVCDNDEIGIRVTSVSQSAWADFLEGRADEADDVLWAIHLSARGFEAFR